jgi:hypothetical protein
MRKLAILPLMILLSSQFIFGQTKQKITHMTLLDFSSIDHAEICKYTKPIIDSTIGAIHRQLNSEQIKNFVDEWNNSTYIGVCKFKPKYRIDIYLKDGTKRTFQINGSAKESRDYCYEPANKKYFKTLWDKANPK